MNFFEMNTTNHKKDVNTGRVTKNSPVVEVFSALSQGKTPNVDAKKLDKSVDTIKEMASLARSGDHTAKSELNAIVRYTIEPRLLEGIKLFDFMGSFKKIPYDEVPMVRTYNYETSGARFQASSGDVPFGTYNFSEYPIATQTISSGFAFNYREIESGNFEGSVAEGMNQVIIDMENKAVYYVIAKLYQGLKNSTGIKHFSEGAGIVQAGVDNMLKVMRRYGKVAITGDYSVVSQMNDFVGFKTIGSTTYPYGADAAAAQIMQTGLLNFYNGANVIELPNSYDYSRIKADGSNYELYMPEGLLFFIPQGSTSPLQIFQRGDLASMTADDIVTRTNLTRFDLEVGAELAKGTEDRIGLMSDSNFEAPAAI